MIKGKEDNISKTKDMDIINQKKEKTWKKTLQGTTLLIDGQVVPLVQIIYKVFL